MNLKGEHLNCPYAVTGLIVLLSFCDYHLSLTVLTSWRFSMLLIFCFNWLLCTSVVVLVGYVIFFNFILCFSLSNHAGCDEETYD